MFYQKDGQPFVKVTTTEVFEFPRNHHAHATEAFCEGGRVIGNTSGGVSGEYYRTYYADDEIRIHRLGSSDEQVLHTVAGITWLDFTFDQNNKPFIVYMRDGRSFYYYTDSQTNITAETELPDGAMFPCCEMDFKSIYRAGVSDIILAYHRAGKLYYTVQRERFNIEHEITDADGKFMLWRIGRTTDGRFGFHYR